MERSDNKSQRFTRRAFFLIACKTVLLSILGINIYNIQIISGSKYKLLSDKNRIKVNIIQPPRGIITDRNGEIIVNNAFSYGIIIENEKNIEQVLQELKHICKDILTRGKSICGNLTWNEVAKIESNIHINDSVKITQSYQRVYIYKDLLGYITGYSGIPSRTDIQNNDRNKDLLIGKNGVEMFFDEQLQGTCGVQKVEVNAFGKTVREISNESSIQGINLNLSIDIRLQKKIAYLNDDRRGIYLAMNVKTGEILGMYSTPGYDPNLFTNGIKSDDWRQIMKHPDKPMINRAISSLYPPGSTFKMMTLLAILHSGISPNESIFCSGEHRIGNRVLHCWKKYGHGYINAYNCLENSCNIYLAVQGMKAGIESISKMALEFGFGTKTNIELPYEVSGLIPNKEWKKQRHKHAWTFGDTVNTSIGQGYTLVTPIQLLQMTARIASGTMVKPTLTLLHESFPKLKNVNEQYLQIVRDCMFNVMRNHHWEGLKIAGKTGTAQVISKRDAKGKHGDHSIFVGFAPYDSPQYAVFSIVENAGWGSENALPITKEIFRSIFELQI